MPRTVRVMTSVIRINESIDQEAIRKARDFFAGLDDDILDEIPGVWMDEILKRKGRNDTRKRTAQNHITVREP